MLSDAGITLAGHTITTVQLLSGGVVLLSLALLLALVKAKKIALQRSVVTDEIAIQLGRIADTLDQLAGEARSRNMLQNARQTELPPLKTSEQDHPISYSMFGR
jgi:hypothetical protein